ncbi:MAG: hypothetical protein AAF170_19465 [Bacteroidota bacterium]
MHASVTAFLNRVWDDPSIHRLTDEDDLVWDIYDLYTPQPPQGVDASWTQVQYNAAPTDQMGWRVYISATPAHLMTVWNRLQPLFNQQPGVVAAKHTTVAGAATRVDTIVVYLRNSADKDALIAGIQALHQGRVLAGRPPVPPKLRPMMFKQQVPPTTMAVPGLQGVSHAQQPVGINAAQQPEGSAWKTEAAPIPHLVSFGQQLAEIVAKAYHKAPSKAEFFKRATANFMDRGVDVNQPWQQLVSQAERQRFADSGVLARGDRARAKRGYHN